MDNSVYCEVAGRDSPSSCGVDPLSDPSRAEHVRQNQVMMRRVRWIGVLFALIQFGLYRPPPGMTVPFDRLVAAAGVALALIAVNVTSLWATHRRDTPPVSWVYLGLAIDTAVVMTIVWLFTFDATSALWALLVVPVLEGAYVGGLAGALRVWGVCVAGYGARELWASDAFDRALEIESVTYRMGIVLIVAVTSGFMSRDLTVQMKAHAAARAESDHRSELLRVVASSGRLMAVADNDLVLAAIVDGAIQIGFQGAEICIFDEDTRTWRSVHSRSLPAGYPGQAHPIDAGLAGRVWRSRERVVVEDYSEWEDSIPGLRGEGFRSVVGIPIWSNGEVVAALVAGNREVASFDAHALEALDLFSAQAGAALGTLRFLNQMRHQALHDALTGLPNLTLFEDRLAQAVAMARRGPEVLAVGVLDIDNFKRINDSLGHDAGNELLKSMSGRLRHLMREADTVARMGGDEFTFLLPGLSDADDVVALAEKILSAFERPFLLEGERYFLTASLGIALYPTDGLAPSTLLRSADSAMYRVKKRGRNGYELHHGDVISTNRARLSLETELYRALERGDLSVQYQPVLDLRERRVVGVEALVRWAHAQRGSIEPEDFVGLAEESGLIAAIDTWVLRTACMQAKKWSDGGLPGLRVSVNVSAPQLTSPSMRAVVAAALADSGLDPACLDLEVTERVAAGELSGCVDVLSELRSCGVGVSIDDFGTGYSALDRLQELSVDRLKIDKSFIRQIDIAGDSPIVSAAIAMAHSLNLEVVAEGVETVTQLQFLEKHGCDLAQGYLFSRAVDADRVPDIVRGPLFAEAHLALTAPPEGPAVRL